MKMRILPIILTVLFALAYSPVAYAQCANPVGAEGDVMFNETYNLPQYCDDTNWIAMNGGRGSPAFNSNKANCTVNNGGPFTQVGIQAIPPATQNLWATDDYIYAEARHNGLYAYSFDGSSFTAAGTVDPGDVAEVWSDGDYVFVAAEGDGLIAYTHDGSSFTEVDRIAANTDDADGIMGDDNYIYIRTGTNTSFSVRIEAYSFDGSTLTYHDDYTPASDVRAMCGSNDGYVHVAGNGTLTGLNFDGSTLSLAGSIALPGVTSAIWCDDNYIFVGTFSSNRLLAYTFDGSTYTLAGSDTSTRSSGSMWYDGTHIFIPVDDGTRDIRAFTFDGSTFTEEDTIATPDAFGPFGVWGDGTYIYAADNGSGIVAYDGFSCLSTSAGAGSTQTNVVSNGLVGHWRLDETSGSTAYDSSGNGNNGTRSGNETDFASDSVEGIIGNALDLGATGTCCLAEVIEVSSGTGFPTGAGAEFSLSFWVYGQNPATGLLFAYGDTDPYGSGSNTWVGLGQWSDFIRLETQSGTMDINSWTAEGEWTHITLTQSATEIRVYTNGVEHSSTYANVISPESAFLRLGDYDTDWAGEMSAILDDVRFYNRAITADEITQIYQARDGIRYNPSHRTMEYFDGNGHISMTPEWKDVDVAPIYTFSVSGCPNIGDICADGSVYAGTSPDGNTPMYTTPADAPGNYQWNEPSSNDYTVTGATDSNAGASNTAILIVTDSDETDAGVQLHDAAQYCADLSVHGHTDWHLPARYELIELYNNRAAIGGFATSQYWSSTETAENTAILYNFSSGSEGYFSTKNTVRPIRCVRKSPMQITGQGGLVGHWKLDETSGTTAVDSSGNGNDGTYYNVTSVTSTPGPVGLASSFISSSTFGASGEGTYALVPADASLDVQTPTVAGWVKFDGPSSSGGILFGRRHGSVNPWNSFAVTMGSGRSVTCNASTGISGSQVNSASQNLTYGQWHHVACTHDGTNLRKYIDGALVDTVSFAGPVGYSSEPFHFAIENDSSNEGRHMGAIDDVRLYDRPLSLTEIQMLYQMGAPVGSSTALPQGCPTAGDFCDDGSFFVGNSPDGNVEMYMTDMSYEGASILWGTSPQANNPLTGINDVNDGDGNTATLVTTDSDTVTAGFQTHPAAQYCYDLVAHGADDWYLPAQDELAMLYNGGAGLGDISTGGRPYWSSTERSGVNTQAKSRRFNQTFNANSAKPSANWVRCARKGPAPRCANPYGMEGDVVYNTTHDVMQFCDGARWRAIGK